MKKMSCGWSGADKDWCWEESRGKVISSISGPEIVKKKTFGRQMGRGDETFHVVFHQNPHDFTSVMADRGVYEYLCVFVMKGACLGRWADIGLTGLWGRRCLLNDYYHRNLRLAVLNTAQPLPRPRSFALIWAARRANRWGISKWNTNRGFPWELLHNVGQNCDLRWN